MPRRGAGPETVPAGPGRPGRGALPGGHPGPGPGRASSPGGQRGQPAAAGRRSAGSVPVPSGPRPADPGVSELITPDPGRPRLPAAGRPVQGHHPAAGRRRRVRGRGGALARYGRVDKVVGIEARGFILAAPVACRLGGGLRPRPQAGQATGPNDARVVSARVRHGDRRGARGTRSSRGTGCWSSTTCSPPAGRRPRPRAWSAAAAPRSPRSRSCWNSTSWNGRARLPGFEVRSLLAV